MPIVTYTIIFAVLGDPDDTALALAVATNFAENYVLIRPGQWLISANGTAKDISTIWV